MKDRLATQDDLERAYRIKRDTIFALTSQVTSTLQSRQPSSVEWSHIADLDVVETMLVECLKFLRS
jgi:hypothetical protein